MKWKITVEADGSHMTILATGEMQTDGFRSHIESALAQPGWRPGLPVLCDFRFLKIGWLSLEDIKHIIEVHRSYSELFKKYPSPVAVVVSSTLAFGLVRMWGLYANDLYPENNVFLDMEDALDWIRSVSKEVEESSLLT